MGERLQDEALSKPMWSLGLGQQRFICFCSQLRWVRTARIRSQREYPSALAGGGVVGRDSQGGYERLSEAFPGATDVSRTLTNLSWVRLHGQRLTTLKNLFS